MHVCKYISQRVRRIGECYCEIFFESFSKKKNEERRDRVS